MSLSKTFCSFFVFCSLILLTFHQAAFAGGASTGGGSAFVCRGLFNIPVSAELVDLWESIHRRHWNIPYTNEAVDVQIDRAVAKLKDLDLSFYQSVVADLAYVRSHVEYLPEDQEIALPPDVQNGYQKQGCPAAGMMLFDGETQNLSIKGPIFDKLINNTNVAAAWTHEAVYKTMRRLIPTLVNSIEARKLTSCLFATNDCLGPIAVSFAEQFPGLFPKNNFPGLVK